MSEPEYKLCKRGHVRSPENLDGTRHCRECRKINDRIISQTPKRKEYEKSRYDKKRVYRSDRKDIIARYNTAQRNDPGYKDKCKERRSSLTDGYIRSLIRTIPASQVSEDLIEIKRLSLQLERIFRNGNKLNGTNNNNG